MISRSLPRCSKNQHRTFPIVHKTDAAIDTDAEIIKQMAQTAGKTPLNICHRDLMWQDFSGQKITQHLGTASHSPMGLDIRSLNVVSGGYRTPRYIQIFPALPLACFGNGGGGLTLFSGYGRSSPKVRYPNSYLFDSCCR
jgi:hypothetical protein